MFAGTVEHYREYRPGIPKDVADVLATSVPDRRPQRLLDVGTGTGLVVEALLTRFDDIMAIDTDAEMLAADLRPPDQIRLVTSTGFSRRACPTSH